MIGNQIRRNCNGWGRCLPTRQTINWTPGRADYSIQRRNCPSYCRGYGVCDRDGVCRHVTQGTPQTTGWGPSLTRQVPIQRRQETVILTPTWPAQQIKASPLISYGPPTTHHSLPLISRAQVLRKSPPINPPPKHLKQKEATPPPKETQYWEDLSNCGLPEYDCIPRISDRDDVNCAHCEDVLHGKCHSLGVCFVKGDPKSSPPPPEDIQTPKPYWEDLTNCLLPEYDCVPRANENDADNCAHCETVLHGKCNSVGICFVKKGQPPPPPKNDLTPPPPPPPSSNYWEDLSNCALPEFECIPKKEGFEIDCARCEISLEGKCHPLGICVVKKVAKNYWEDLTNCGLPEYDCVPRTSQDDEDNCQNCENVRGGRCHAVGVCVVKKA